MTTAAQQEQDRIAGNLCLEIRTAVRPRSGFTDEEIEKVAESIKSGLEEAMEWVNREGVLALERLME
jgi:hypothetical protein